jgi:hypothetical protein
MTVHPSFVFTGTLFLPLAILRLRRMYEGTCGTLLFVYA